MRLTKALFPVVVLSASLSANAALACCTEPDAPDADAAVTASEREPEPMQAAASWTEPPARIWRSASAAEDEARSLAARDVGTPAASGVQRLALSALAEHAARAMGAESARVLGLDAVAPAIAVGEVPRSVPPAAGPGRRPVGLRPATLVPNPYDGLIEEAAIQHAVSADLVRAVVKVESNFQPHARSPKGAIGLMQVMPATGRRFGAVDLHDPRTNIQAGTRYLRWLLTRFGDDMTLALAAYNAGEGAVEKHGRQVPPYAETRDYVGKVLRHLSGSDVAPAASSVVSAGRADAPAGDTRAAATAGWPLGTAPVSPRAAPASPPPSVDKGQSGSGTLQTVATWMGALLTSAYRPRLSDTVVDASAGPVAEAAMRGATVRLVDAFSPGPR